jgi:DNA-binding CsgD family transcriptional regulator
MEARVDHSRLEPPRRRSLSPRETIDLLSRSRQAAFGIDSAERIVYWNRPCEALLSHPPAKVLGKHCFDVIAGRDENGNRYCSRNCPVALQARSDEIVNPFTLVIRDGAGAERALRFRTFAVPAIHAELSVVVHVVAEREQALSATETALARLAAAKPVARWPLTIRPAAPLTLTTREREIILGFAEGLSTNALAGKLGIAAVTVRNHTQRILLKFDVHSKLAAVVYAYRHQLL